MYGRKFSEKHERFWNGRCYIFRPPNRPSKNISEVTLLLDNQNKEGPSQLKEFDEISVKRNEKDKGSKYYINEKEVRARDVQTLFADLSTELILPL